MDIKDTFKKQMDPNKGPQVRNTPDSRFKGHNRIYFFRRKLDDFIFPLDTELQASHQMRNKNFNQEYEYIGWSSGQHYAAFLKKKPLAVKYNEDAEVTEDSKADMANKMLSYNEMLELEFNEAVDNPDKTLPRDFTKKNISGGFMDPRLNGQF